MTEAEEKILKTTIGNLIAMNDQMMEGFTRATTVMAQLQSRVEALENARKIRPAIIDVRGARVN